MNRLTILTILFAGLLATMHLHAQSFCTTSTKDQLFRLSAATILIDSQEAIALQTAAQLLQDDIEKVTGTRIPLLKNLSGTHTNAIVIGTLSNPAFKSFTNSWQQEDSSQWEGYRIKTFDQPGKTNHLLIISGNDMRGAIYGIMDLSRQMGVSPWYWWADVPIARQPLMGITKKLSFTDAPKVKYRGIFINDEAPSLAGWAKEKFGGFNHLFYEKVFELLLRLKGNYIWPAMWGNAFYDDDSLNKFVAEKYGVVIGTSHHEPLMRAHDEWRRYGQGPWNYDSNAAELQAFWRKGMTRATNEKIVTVGMRGDGDKPMSRETATALLERIVTDQRKIIGETTHQPAASTPQLWALYKEVQDYYDKGMTVPDDVTLLLCDDNWGNIRRLPSPTQPPRTGGYGIYYHFDYVGGPRNYKWINTNALPRVWEQMHLAYSYHADRIWIVNVGDIKPMELPASFFLDYAWNPERIGPTDINRYTESWAAQQFGPKFKKQIAELLSKYAKYNARRKPELLDENTYSLNHYNEFLTSTQAYQLLATKATAVAHQLAPQYQDAFYQLVNYPIQASANLYNLYYNTALNHATAASNPVVANQSAQRATWCFQQDSILSATYHKLNHGKWNHMMDQVHIGYTGWQQPDKQIAPLLYAQHDLTPAQPAKSLPGIAAPSSHPGYVSIAADHYSGKSSAPNLYWQILPDHGKTGNGITSFPVTAPSSKPETDNTWLAYNFNTSSTDSVTVNLYCSPTLNFLHKENGLQLGVSIDDSPIEILSLNADEQNVTTWNQWVSDNCIVIKTRCGITAPGRHLLRIWRIDPGVVLQKIVIDLGGLKDSYLGPPETKTPAK